MASAPPHSTSSISETARKATFAVTSHSTSSNSVTAKAAFALASVISLGYGIYKLEKALTSTPEHYDLNPSLDFTDYPSSCLLVSNEHTTSSAVLHDSARGEYDQCYDHYVPHFTFTLSPGVDLTERSEATARSVRGACGSTGLSAIVGPTFSAGDTIDCWAPSPVVELSEEQRQAYFCGNDLCVKLFDPLSESDNFLKGQKVSGQLGLLTGSGLVGLGGVMFCIFFCLAGGCRCLVRIWVLLKNTLFTGLREEGERNPFVDVHGEHGIEMPVFFRRFTARSSAPAFMRRFTARSDAPSPPANNGAGGRKAASSEAPPPPPHGFFGRFAARSSAPPPPPPPPRVPNLSTASALSTRGEAMREAVL